MTEEVGLDELEGLLATASVPPAEYIAAAGTDEAPPQRASAADGALHSERSREEKHRRKSKRHRHSDMEKEDEKSRKRSRYVLDTAESGSDEEDDEESEVGAESMASHEPRKAFIFHEGEEAMNDEELGRHFEERDKFLRAQQKNPVTRSGVEKSSYRYAAHLLPQEHDPKVFAIKCRPRMARVLVARIVNKCYAYRNGKNYNECKVDLGIISAFCLDHVKEYLYVEAYRKVFVENALNGLEGLFRYNITVVDPSELMQMLEKRRSNMDRIRVGSFVRLRQRNYRLDIAQVTAVHHDGIHITCKVVPREDFVGKPYAKTTTRLPAKFFIPSVAIDAVDRGDHYQWGDLKFDKEGYLLMQVSARMVISGSHMENPTTEELARFHHDRTRVLEAIEKLTDRGGNLKIGDTVRVISGQLRDAVGTIANIFTNTNTALLHCPVPGKAEPVRLQVELRACAKHFQEGVHVIIEKGEFAGESGTVVKSLGDVVVIFPDRASSNTQFRVQASDCHQSQLKGAFCQAKRGWELFDLVLVGDTNRVGCLVRLSNNDVDVITERNELKTLTYPEIKSVVRGPRQTADRLQNALTRGVEVNIQAHTLTPFNLGGQTARVVHVFNRTLFVCCRSIPENSGVVALSADCVLLAGGRTTTRHVAPPKQLPAPLRRPHNATKADISGSLRQQSEDWQQNSECFEMSSTDHNGH